MTRFFASWTPLLAGAVSAYCAVVTNCSESGLRAAIAQGGTVTFNCNGTIGVSRIVITNNTTLDGSGVAVTISGQDSQSIFEVLSNCTLTLVSLTLANGRDVGSPTPGYPIAGSSGFGGAIRMTNATVVASDCLFVDNTAEGGSGVRQVGTGSYGGGAFGGAICAVGGSVLLTNCVFKNNAVVGGEGGIGPGPVPTRLGSGFTRGGAIYIDTGTLTLSRCSFLSNTSPLWGKNCNVLITDSSFATNSPMRSPFGSWNGEGGAAFFATPTNAEFIRCNFTGNFTPGNGAALHLYTLGHVIMDSCKFESNTSSNGGGALSVSAYPLFVRDSLFFNNSAPNGGAAYYQTSDGLSVFSNSMFVGNSAQIGGAVYFGSDSSRTNTFINCLFASNTANAGSSYNGGGGAIFNPGNCTISNCSFVANTANTSHYFGGGGAILLPSLTSTTSRIANCMFVSNTANRTNFFAGESIGGGGGAILSGGALVISNCTFASNIANLFGGPGGGGALNHYSDWTSSVVNCTFTANQVNSSNVSAGGGALYTFSALTLLRFCTIASNVCTPGCHGAGIYSAVTNARAALSGVIFSGNLVGQNSENLASVSGSIDDLGYNLSSDATPFFHGSSRTNIDSRLGQLTDNGGGVLTMALLPASPAIDGFQGLGFPSVDARGIARPQRFGCDIGAYELISFLALIVRSNQNVLITYPSDLNHAYTLESKSVLDSAWGDVETKTSATSTVEFSLGASNRARFFRIRE